MKSILIPSVLEEDTVLAVEAAIAYSPEKKIVLLFLHDLPDEISATATLRNMNNLCTAAQKKVLATCRDIGARSNRAIEVHNQYGLSRPLLRNLMDFLDVETVSIPDSFVTSPRPIHRQLVTLLKEKQLPLISPLDEQQRPVSKVKPEVKEIEINAK